MYIKRIIKQFGEALTREGHWSICLGDSGGCVVRPIKSESGTHRQTVGLREGRGALHHESAVL